MRMTIPMMYYGGDDFDKQPPRAGPPRFEKRDLRRKPAQETARNQRCRGGRVERLPQSARAGNLVMEAGQ